MALSTITYTGDGSTTQFAVNFPLGYISKSYVKARVGTEVDGSNQPVYRTINFNSDNIITISGAPAGVGVPVVISRRMPRDILLVDFEDNAVLTEGNLNTAQRQAIMLVHEALDINALSFDNIYTKDVVDAALAAIDNIKANKNSVYTISQVNTLVNGLRSDVEAALTGKANSADVYSKANTYSRDEIATLFSSRDTRLLPSGGTSGQVLQKVNGTDYNVVWATPASGGGTVTTAQLKAERMNTWNVKTDGGAVGNNSNDDTAAFQNGFNAIRTAGGGRLFIPPGTYRIPTQLDITNISNMLMEGVSVDSAVINANMANGNHCFNDNGTSWWRTFRDFSVINPSIARTTGAVFRFTNEKRGLMDRVKITGHATGVNYLAFEQSEQRSVSITAPSGAGYAVIAGQSQAGGLSGVNLLLNSCFYRGFDDVTQAQSGLVGLAGLYIRDSAAVFAVNTDWSAFVNSDVIIEANNKINDHHFVQCFFDSTKNSHCVNLIGDGIKEKVTFTGCWFGGGGQFGSGAEASNACGFYGSQNGTYSDIQFTGCRFYAHKGAGLMLTMLNADVMVTGCTFNTCGFGGNTGQQGGVMWAPPSTSTTRGPMIVANRFRNNTGGDARFTNEANKHVVTNNVWTVGKQGGGTDTNIVNNFIA